MIKYLGSKRVLVPVLGVVAEAVKARSALDLFTGTTRVAQEFKRRGLVVTAVDLAAYSQVLAQCFIATDASDIDTDELGEVLGELAALPGVEGYFTQTFCEEARFFQPKNGRRVDAIRDVIERDWVGHPFYPLLLTSLLLGADRVDSTTGLQMAYLKHWAARAQRDLELRVPELLPGSGRAVRGDALSQIRGGKLGHFDVAYLDPPYNQHRYFTNYHIWETLVRWDAPEHYGKACKRLDARAQSSRGPFDSKVTMPLALRDCITGVDADVVVVSFNNEAWVGADDIVSWLYEAGHAEVAVFDFDYKRYVGAQIGVYDPSGAKVGTPGHLRNIEHLFVAGQPDKVSAVREALAND